VARPPRLQLANGIYHVTARGNRGQAIFFEDRDRVQFLNHLTDVATKLTWWLHAYCLMTNHYHLVFETVHPNLSLGMQRLNSRYAQWFNQRHGAEGHLFRGRFHAVLVETDSHLVELSRYLALNPIRAGLCQSPADWRWSSYRAIFIDEQWSPRLSWAKVLSYFDANPQRAREALRSFVEGEPSLGTIDRLGHG
jgi:putative transposase